MKSLIWRVLATLLLLGPLSVGAMADSAPPSHWAPDIDAFVAADRAHPPASHGVLFIGSSSIQYWKSLAQDFPGTGATVRSVSAGMTLYPTGNKQGALWEVEDEMGNKGWISSTQLQMAK